VKPPRSEPPQRQERGHGRHVTLATLLAAHEADAGATPLAANLGDGALYRRNPVFRSIRDAALALGCRFTDADGEGYFAWPLVHLTRLLETRVIPYRRTRDAFATLERSRPGYFTTQHAEMVAHEVNAVLHEGAHCIADAAWSEAAPPCRRLAPHHRTVLRYALAEAFANASELAAMAHARAKTDAWLLALNSYWSHLPRIPQAWAKLGTALGAAQTARWLILCFLTSNLCHERLTPPLRARLLALAGIAASDAQQPAVRRELELLATEAFNLSLDFRASTATVFYASLGLDVENGLEALTGFDHAAVLAEDAVLRGVLDRLAALLTQA
jgi:hypothetical protein